MSAASEPTPYVRLRDLSFPCALALSVLITLTLCASVLRVVAYVSFLEGRVRAEDIETNVLLVGNVSRPDARLGRGLRAD